MAQTGHRSVQMVRRDIRDGSLFRENSAGKLGRCRAGRLVRLEDQSLSRPYPYWMFLLEGIHYVN